MSDSSAGHLTNERLLSPPSPPALIAMQPDLATPPTPTNSPMRWCAVVNGGQQRSEKPLRSRRIGRFHAQIQRHGGH